MNRLRGNDKPRIFTTHTNPRPTAFPARIAAIHNQRLTLRWAFLLPDPAPLPRRRTLTTRHELNVNDYDQPTPEHHDTPIERAADSSIAKVVQRLILPAAFIVIGWLIVDKLDSIKKTQETQSATIAIMQTALVEVTAKLDYGVLEQVKSNDRRITKLEERAEREDQARMAQYAAGSKK